MTGTIERRLAILLRAGVIAASIVVGAGALWFLAVHGAEPAATHSRDDTGLIRAGILILIATPIVRVAFSVAAFARQGDRAYVAITATVFLILIYSMFLGR